MLLKRIITGWILWLTSCLIGHNIVYASLSSQGATTILATVTANCHVNNATMNFGNYDPISKNATAPLDGLTSFDIACTKGAAASISLSAGNNGSHARTASRAMSAGHPDNDYLSYDLYINSGYTTIWNTSNVVQFVATNKNTKTIAVYGRIPPGQDVGAGYYNDVVNIVANF